MGGPPRSGWGLCICTLCTFLRPLLDFKWIYKRAKCDPNGLRIAIFSKTLQKIAQRRGFAPKPWSVIRLSYTSLLAISPNLQFFENFPSFGLSPEPL